LPFDLIILPKFACKIKAKNIKNKSKHIELKTRLAYFNNVSELITSYFDGDQNNWTKGLINAIKDAENYNPWFTKINIENALRYWSIKLTTRNLKKWVKKYNFNHMDSTVAIIMAGNFPLAGFHDFICGIISGNKIIVKPSSDDKILICFFIDYLKSTFPELDEIIGFSDKKLSGFDKVIATGSNNTFNYFEYYFRNKKSILRKNRSSVAVLDGNESVKELENLSKDIFQYFGLGCRNVSKIFIPIGYNLEKFKKHFAEFKDIIYHNKYSNNYNYHKTIKIMNNEIFIDGEYFILKESREFSPPISVINYHYYNKISEVKKIIQDNCENIQCIVSNCDINNKIKFGDAQNPDLHDYSDNIDTLNFLLTK